MQQTFQCYRCGAQNYVGQPVCWNCHSHIQFNCPNCHTLVNPTYANCPYCKFPLPWHSNQRTQPTNYQAQKAYQEPEISTGRNPWLVGILAVVLFAMLGGGTVFAINNWVQKPPEALPQSKSASTTPVTPITTPSITSTTTPPLITKLWTREPPNAGHTELIVSWETDKPSSSQVQYGIYPNPDTMTPIYNDPLKGANLGVLVHEVHLTNLSTVTSYIYRAISVDTNGNKTVSPDTQFTTGGIASPKAYKPAKCDVKISATDEDSIAWTAGTLIFVDGTKQEITAGTADLIELKTNYVYWVVGKKALQLATSPSQATGQDSGIIATVVPGYLLQPTSLKAAISMVD